MTDPFEQLLAVAGIALAAVVLMFVGGLIAGALGLV